MHDLSRAARRDRRRIDWWNVIALSLAGFGLIFVLAAIPAVDKTLNWADDFLAYRSASIRLATEGTLYLPVSLSGEFEPVGQNLYLYPPPFGVAMGPLAVLGPEDGTLAWYLIHVAALVLSCALMPVDRRLRIAAFGIGCLSFCVLRDLILGNVSVLLLLPLVVAWRWLDRPVGSLALALATSVRVTFGVFVFWLFVRRAWRPLAWVIGGMLVLLVLTLPFVGLEGYRDYLTVLVNVGGTEDLIQNRHLTYPLLRLGLPPDVAWLVLPPVWALALVAVAHSRRRDPEVGFMVTVGASLLLAPLIWDHYLSAILLPSVFLAARGRPWALVLPLLSWLPAELLPVLPIGATLLPFLARDRTPGDGAPALIHHTGELVDGEIAAGATAA